MVNVIRKDKEHVANGRTSIFKMEVFEPPCLSVDVIQRDMAGLVEACIGGTQMRVRLALCPSLPCLQVLMRLSLPQTVVVQCDDDYKTIASFTDSANNVIRQHLPRLHWTKIDRPYQPQQGPVPREQVSTNSHAVSAMVV